MLRPFLPIHAHAIEPQAAQPLDFAARERIICQAVPRGPCWTAIGDGDRVLAIGGFAMIHAGWATGWTILADGIGQAMVGLTRAVRGELERMHAARIDMHVDPQHLEGARWAAMLGFRLEAILDRAQPDGGPVAVWLYEGNARG